MKLLTPVDIKPLNNQISYYDRGLVIGSCFATLVGERFANRRFNVKVNPNGVLYNPISILQCLNALKKGQIYTKQDLVLNNGLWHSFDHHGSFSSTEPNEILHKINIKPILPPDYIIVTLGTAWVYEHNGKVVANCHKIHENQFSRRRLSFYEITQTLNCIAQTFPNAIKIFTVSPIRHIKDGLQENSFSKALLRAAVGTVVEQTNNCYYFPAFEILYDELRDYRFYEPDMAHPTKQAADYIWKQFAQYCLSKNTLTYVDEIDKILRAEMHRPIHPSSEQFINFKQSIINQINSFSERYKNVDLSDILAKFAK